MPQSRFTTGARIAPKPALWNCLNASACAIKPVPTRSALWRPAAARGDCARTDDRPELLLLDEITSALDPMLVGEVLNMVAELKAQGTTILMATHEMSFAHEAADRIVLLRHGVIAENGTPAEVMDESQDPETIESSAISGTETKPKNKHRIHTTKGSDG